MSISFLMYYFMYDVGDTDCEMLIILNGVPRFGVHGSSNTRFWDMGKSQGQTVPLIRLFLLIFTLVLNIPIIEPIDKSIFTGSYTKCRLRTAMRDKSGLFVELGRPRLDF